MLQLHVLTILTSILYSNNWSEEVVQSLQEDMQYVVEGNFSNHADVSLGIIFAKWRDRVWKEQYNEEEYQVSKMLEQALKDL